MDYKIRFGKLIGILKKMIALFVIKGEKKSKIDSFTLAIHKLEQMEPDANEIESLSGSIDPDVLELCKELLQTGTAKEWEELQREIPSEVRQMLLLPGLSAEQIGIVYRKLGVDSLAKLHDAAKKQKLRKLTGFGAKVELRILKYLKQMKIVPERLPIAFVYPIAHDILAQLRTYKEIQRAEIAGELRRFEETVEKLDIVIATEHGAKVIERIRDFPNVLDVIEHEEHRIHVRLEYLWPVKVDFWVVPNASFASAWLYATGSKDHLSELQERAKQQQSEIRPLGMVKTKQEDKLMVFESESSIYDALHLPYIPPEIRVGGEHFQRIEKSQQVPRLIEMSDLQGDLHMHTNWSDGGNSIEEMARAAHRRGYKYIAITDHSRSLKIAGGLSIERLLRQREEIKKIEQKLQKEFGEFTILCGVEMDILADGSFDYPDEVLQELDLVIASIHTSFQQDEYRMTKRIMDAILNNHVDFIAHPTGRMIARREPYAINMEILFTAAKETGTVLELNSNPERLDLKAEYVQEAVEKYRIPITINTDAHSVEELDNITYGIGTARRGWLQREHVVNTWPLERLLAYLKRND